MDERLIARFARRPTTEDETPLSVTLYFPDNPTPVTLVPIVEHPPIEDEIIPGSSSGTGVLRLFIRFEAAVVPPSEEAIRGCTAEYGGVAYDVVGVLTDAEGGVGLTLRKRSLAIDA